jgi:hypothetical protein
MALGVTVTNRSAPPASGVPTDTGTLFVAGAAAAGSLTEAKLVRSIADFETEYGVRAAGNQDLYDYVDTFFREGGQRAYVVRYTVGAGNLATALGLFSKSLGPGQVADTASTPTATIYGELLNHAAATNRFALLDVANADTVAAMTTLAGAVPAVNDSYGALFGPWVDVPAPAGVIGGSVRNVRATAVVAGLIARADAQGIAARAPAGRDFPLQYVNAFRRLVTDAELETLLNAGLNMLITKYSVMQLYGFQTGIAQSTDTPFWQANASRSRMWLTAQAQAVGEGFMFKPIDGRGKLQEALKRALIGVGDRLYGADGLFGETLEDAFAVETGISVNTPTSIANGELRAVAQARFSMHTKAVQIDLVSVPITGNVVQPAA